ncbi:sigma-70 family RNA polymerase sigma factor [Ancylobacter sp. TS-1]|uniref:sigma-70 family RNA polymerase sigma factor n=1 Tax=Ancylobacter sp. TS-1 TaxID=1850374 RepID=UPI001265C683|nr:sigma-70 family RNA polymerase sigma factor [Ancylobacter sp. TS-1]QFR33788.1 sigma-70 family RNA polymerase sigma factor [Ancylobacter sp. TS-1]
MDVREATWSEAMRAERRGDALAYEAFLRDFAASMRRVVTMQLRRLGFGPDEAEDVVQEVLIAVHSRRGQWDTARPLLPWLNAIARYKTIDALRRLHRQARGRVDLSDEEWSTMFVSGESERAREAMDVDRLIATLPAGQQAAVRAVAIEGVSHREAADRLGTTEGAVRVAFHRSLRKLMTAARQEDRQ